MIAALRSKLAARVVDEVGAEEICARFGHVPVPLNEGQDGRMLVGSGCLRCGKVEVERVYVGRYPRPRP